MLSATLVFLLLLPPARQDPSRGSISGVIRDFTTKEPLSGVSVVQSGTQHKTTTDAEGRFRLANIRPGLAFVEVSLEGYPTVRYQVHVVADSTAELSISLPKFPPRIGKMPVYVPDSSIRYRMRFVDPTKGGHDSGKDSLRKKDN